MAERPATEKPVLQKPPGYRDPAAARPAPPKPPPRRAPLPPAFRQAGKPPPHRSHRSRRGRHCCRRLCCWLLLLLVLSCFILAAAAALAYLWFQPRLPAFRIQAIQPSRFNVSARSDGSYLDAAVAVRVQAANANAKLTLAFGDVTALISIADDDGDVEIGSSSASGFVLQKKNSTVMRLAARAKGLLVDDAVGGRLKARFRSKEIKFSVEMRTRVGVRVGGKSTGKMPIRVLCDVVSLRQVESGTPAPKCDINLLRWINLH